MTNFFSNQLDYIFFFYGLAFILLVPVCQILRRKSQPQPPWGRLALFGVTHGLNEWLDLVALIWGSHLPFDIIRLGLMALSFGFLLEFGRAGTVANRGAGPGRWIFAPLLFVALLGGLAGLPGLFVSIRYSLGLVGGLWAALTLYLVSRTSAAGSRAMLAAALGMAGYALATGLVVNPAPFFPAALVNYDSFLVFTGVPIQLIRGLTAVWISVSLWFVARSIPEEDMDSRTVRMENYLAFGAVALLSLTITAGWILTQFIGSKATQQARLEYRHLGDLLKDVLTEDMEEVDHLVQVMAESPLLLPALVSTNPQTIAQANSVLDWYSRAFPFAVCYVLNIRGVVIAASNRNQPESLVGRSLAFRPYFQQSVKGEPGHYITLGQTLKRRGYYASFPVKDARGEIVGVAAIKRPLDKAEEVLSHTKSLAFFISPHGIVFLTNQPDEHLKSLWPLSPENLRQLVASRQFGGGPFPAILEREPRDGSECVVAGKRLLVMRQTLTPDGWSLVLLSSTINIAFHRLFGIGVTLIMCLGTIALIIVWDFSLEAASRIATSERLYHSLVEGSPTCVSLFDQEGRYLAINHHGLQAMGRSQAELLGQRFSQVWPQESQAKVEEAVQAVLTGIPMSFEETYIRPDGGSIIWHVFLNPIIREDRSIRRFVGIAHDVTERRAAEMALAQREKQYRLLVQNLPGVVFTGYADWTVDFFDDKIEHLTGYTREEFATHRRKWLDVILPEDLPQVREEFLRDLKTDRTYVREYRIKTREGKILWLQDRGGIVTDQAGRIDYISGVFFDISARKQGEEALRESEARFRAVVESAYDAIISADNQGNIISWNKGAQAIFGYTDQEVLGQPVTLLMPDQSREAHRKGLERLITDGDFCYLGRTMELQGLRRNGEEFPLELSLAAWKAPQGIFFSAIIRDITDRKGAEKALKASLEQLHRTLDGTVTALANTIESRDPYTAGHQQRVAQLACAIAQELGFSEDRIEGMRVMGFLHDIGKIAVPAEILSKSGKLSEHEFNLIRVHCQVGYEILKEVDFPWPMAQATLQHHEKLDGSGYPAGISGSEIIMEARMLAVADVVEAMASHRPYRPALGIEKALEEITKNKGILYDPEVVGACLKLFTEKGFRFEAQDYHKSIR